MCRGILFKGGMFGFVSIATGPIVDSVDSPVMSVLRLTQVSCSGPTIVAEVLREYMACNVTLLGMYSSGTTKILVHISTTVRQVIKVFNEPSEIVSCNGHVCQWHGWSCCPGPS